MRRPWTSSGSARFAADAHFPLLHPSRHPGGQDAQQVSKAVKEERAHRAAAVAEEMHRSYLEGCVGQTYPVLFEQPKNGKFFGHAPNYMEVLVDGAELHNALRTVRITDVDGEALLGDNRGTGGGSMRIGSHFFAYLSRMRFIQRWALMRNTGPGKRAGAQPSGGGAGPRLGGDPQ